MIAENQNKKELQQETMLNRMVIDFLGTGAADWAEEPIETLKPNTCEDVRRFSSIVINSAILVDCPKHTPKTLGQLNMNAAAITDVLVTHSHSDHFCREALALLARQAGHRLRLWGHAGMFDSTASIDGLDPCPLQIGETFKIGAFTVEALEAHHLEPQREKPLHYLFDYAGNKLFYACDGCWLLKNTWYRLRDVHLNAIVWDATIGDGFDGDYRIFEHNNLDMIRLMMRTLQGQNVTDAKTQVLLSHLARTLHPLPTQIPASLAQEGLIAAYDGMRIVVA